AAALTLAAVSGHAAAGALLLAVYSIGLGMPFVLTALLWASLPGLPRRLTRLARPLTLAGGALTIGLGVLIATGAYRHVTSYLAHRGVADVMRLAMTVKSLLENLARNAGSRFARDEDVEALARWDGRPPAHDRERAFVPARVLLQDFTGVPAVVDLAAMRAAVA